MTDETRTLDDLGMEHLRRVVETVADHVGTPVHLVGHSFGGTVALATALAGTVEIRSVTTFEANPPAVIAERGLAELYRGTRATNAASETAARAREPARTGARRGGRRG